MCSDTSNDPATRVTADPVTTPGTDRSGKSFRSAAQSWIRKKDPELVNVKRSIRAAVVMPTAFAVAHVVLMNSQISLFTAFGSFTLLLLVDFPARMSTRVASYLALFVVGSFFIVVGTTASTSAVAAVVVASILGFVTLFVGVLSPQIARSSTGALLTLVLSVAIAQPRSAIGPRLIGWLIAAAFSVPACTLIWPSPWRDLLRIRISSTMSALSRLTASTTSMRADPDARASVQLELTRLKQQYSGTPYPATGAFESAVAVAKLVSRLEWAAQNADLVSIHPAALANSPSRNVLAGVAETIDLCSSLICDVQGHPVKDPNLVETVGASTKKLDNLIDVAEEDEIASVIRDEPDVVSASSESGNSTKDAGDNGIGASLDPGFRVRVEGIAGTLVADATLEAAGSSAVSRSNPSSAEERLPDLFLGRLRSYLSFNSVSFRNAVRGAAGLALAVGIVEVTNLSHGFWVVLGTISVLRSNALGTGSTAVRAIAGTAVGFLVGSAITIGVAGHLVLLWAILPLAVALSGVAPSMISFAAGQAAFTVVVIVLFNIIQPAGWKVGLTRIEDVAIGCAASVAVGVLFWPRGARSAFREALSEAFKKNSAYLTVAVDRLTTRRGLVDTSQAERESTGAHLRLDDAFRQLLAERGAKLMSWDTVGSLMSGANRLRLAAYTLSALPGVGNDPEGPELESVSIAGAVLRDSYTLNQKWYEDFSAVLIDKGEDLVPPATDSASLDETLRRAILDAGNRKRVDQLRILLQMLWADELLQNQRNVQAQLVTSAASLSRKAPARQVTV